jgi:hypothetical protein
MYRRVESSLYVPPVKNEMVNLQATLSAGSATHGQYFPHHPITCHTELKFNEDNSFECEHMKVAPDDPRTRDCVNGSIAFLIMEEAWKRFGK